MVPVSISGQDSSVHLNKIGIKNILKCLFVPHGLVHSGDGCICILYNLDISSEYQILHYQETSDF